MKIKAKKVVEIICIYYFDFILELLVLKYHLPLAQHKTDVMPSVILKH